MRVNALQGIDQGAWYHFQHLEHSRNPLLAQVLEYFSFMGTYPVLLLMVLLFLVLLGLQGRRRAMVYLNLCFFTGVVFVQILIHVVARERPQGWDGSELDSFPSTAV